MSDGPNFLFDECIGKPLTEVIRRFVGFHRHQVGVMHILDRFPAGTHDDIWVAVIAKEDWIVVSIDRGRLPGPKLPNLCATLGVRHILFAASAAQLPQFEKGRAFLRVWRDAINLAQAQAGTRATLRLTGGGPVLDPKPLAPVKLIPDLTVTW